MNNQVLPHNLNAEREIIAASLLDPDCMAIARAVMGAEGAEFYAPHHAAIWKTIASQARLDHVVDTASISTRLKELGKSGAIDTLLEITNQLPNFDATGRHCKMVKDQAAMRATVKACQGVIAEACSTPEDEGAFLDRAEKVIAAATEGRAEDGHMESVGSCVELAIKKAEERSKFPGGLEGHASGLTDLDKKVSGFGRGRLFTIGARPGMGKSALGVTIAMGIAKTGWPVALFSLEMQGSELAGRAISAETGILYEDLRSGSLETADWRKMAKAHERLDELPLFISDKGSVTVEYIARWARRIKRQEGKLGAVAVDYLQLLKFVPGPGTANSNRDQQVGHQTRTLKALAKELDCPVILLAQLNRKLEDRQEKRPMLSDLRESGSIEQDSDVVLFVHQPSKYDPSKDPSIMEVLVSKQRGGQTGFVTLDWDAPHMRISNHAPHRPWEADDAIN